MRALAGVCLLLAACGGAAPQPASPEQPAAESAPGAYAAQPLEDEGGASSLEEEKAGDKPLNSLQEAEQAFADDQSEIDRLLAQPIASDTEAACRRVCAALASLRRSVDAICRLSDDRVRCDNAKRTLAKNEQRVTDSGCSC